MTLISITGSWLESILSILGFDLLIKPPKHEKIFYVHVLFASGQQPVNGTKQNRYR